MATSLATLAPMSTDMSTLGALGPFFISACRVERRACDAGRGAGREAGGREAAAAQAACTEIEGRRTRAGRTVARQLLLVAVKARVVWQVRYL